MKPTLTFLPLAVSVAVLFGVSPAFPDEKVQKNTRNLTAQRLPGSWVVDEPLTRSLLSSKLLKKLGKKPIQPSGLDFEAVQGEASGLPDSWRTEGAITPNQFKGFVLIGKGRMRLLEGRKARWTPQVMAQGDGATWLLGVVPNYGVFAWRVSLIPGATPQQDLLFLNFGDGKTKAAFALRRRARKAR